MTMLDLCLRLLSFGLQVGVEFTFMLVFLFPQVHKESDSRTLTLAQKQCHFW